MLLTNLNRSLLYGVNEQPLDNIAGLPDADFNALSLVDSFLINSTLLSFCLDNEEYPYSIESSPEEQYNPGPNLSGIYLQYGYDVFMAAAPHIIRHHLRHKVLFSPALIIPILGHPEDWYDYQPYLTKLIRKRGQWLSKANEKWSWWNDSMNSAIWDDKSNHLRYSYFRLLRIYKHADSNALILDSWKEEHPESKELLLELIKEKLSEEDKDLFAKIYLLETGRLKNTIRMLLFWTSNDDEFSGLKGRLAGGQEPPNILHSIAEGSSISQYYNAEEDIPIEWLVFLDTTSTSGQKIALQTIKKVTPTAGKKLQLYNNLLFGTLFCRQYENLLFWINHIWSEQPKFRLERSWILYFNQLDDHTKNQIILSLLHKNQNIFCLQFVFQVLEQAFIHLGLHSSTTFLSLLSKIVNSDAASLKLCLYMVKSERIPFILHGSDLKSWEVICQNLLNQANDKSSDKIMAKTKKLITFREIIDKIFHE